MRRESLNHQPISVLYVGPYDRGTCKARYEAMKRTGLHVKGLNYRKLLERMPTFFAKVELKLGIGPFIPVHNKQILREARTNSYDWVWVDQGREIYPQTIRRLRGQGLFVVHHINDDFKNPKGMFARYVAAVPDYHVHFTIHQHHHDELKALGARVVLQTYHGFDPEFVFPRGTKPSPDQAYRTDVIFIGHRRDYCEACILNLIENDISVTVWGPGWERSRNKSRFRDRIRFHTLDYPDYAVAIASAKIGLAFLSHENRNQSTIRSFEIPAIGTFMLGERTEEHLSFYREGEEAEFFGSPAELLEKVKFYLAHDSDRAKIAASGHERAISSGYSYFDRVKEEVCNVMPHYKTFLASGR